MRILFRFAQRPILATLVAATVALAACSLDVGLGRSNCTVYGQNPTGSANGLTVLVNLPQTCPFRINYIPQAMAFSATILASSAYTPDGSILYHMLTNRQGTPTPQGTTEWVESTSGLVRTAVTRAYSAATGYFTINGTPSSTAGLGEDRWYLGASQLDSANFGATVGSTAYVRLNYYREFNTTIETDVAFANPYEPVTLTVNVPPWVPSPHRHVWYRNGEFIGEGGQAMVVGAGGPSETVDFEVVTTGSDGTQMRGGRSITSREQSCSDPNVFIC
jgi:hypothetical protein